MTLMSTSDQSQTCFIGYFGSRECGPTTTSTTTTSTTTTTTEPPTTTPVYCSQRAGYIDLYLQFYNYSNPTDQKATGIRCDAEREGTGILDYCDLVIEVCVSEIGSRSVIQ